MNEGTWVQGKSMNVMHQTGNVAWSIFDADYGLSLIHISEPTRRS